MCIDFVPPLVYRNGFVPFVEFLSEDSRNSSRGEGGDVELGARNPKHILVFAFGYKLYSLYISHCYYYLSIHT